MRRLSTALAALTLGFAPLAAQAAPAAAPPQVIVPEAQGEAALEHMRQATSAAERVTALLVKVSTDPAYAAARTPEEMRVAIAGMRDDLAASRQEIRTIVARLNALPPVADEDDHAELQLVDRVVTDIAAFSTDVDQLLGTVETLGDALEAGDEARIQQAAITLMRGSVTVIEGQSLMLRARLPMLPSDSSGFAQVTSLACFYEGFANFQRGMLGLVRPETAGAGMERAVACMTGENARGVAAVERETALEHGDPRLNALRDGLAPVHQSMFKELDDAAQLLDEARRALVRGDTPESLTKFAQRTTAFEQRYQALVGREVDVAARQAR